MSDGDVQTPLSIPESPQNSQKEVSDAQGSDFSDLAGNEEEVRAQAQSRLLHIWSNGFRYLTRPLAPCDKSLQVRRLPVELLMEICRMAITPHVFLDYTLNVGSTSAWCESVRFRKGLTLVSKAWRDVGMVLLYEHVILRRCHQLFLLNRTLRDRKENAELVRSLSVLCFVPTPLDSYFSSNLTSLLGNLPRLTTVEVMMPSTFNGLPLLVMSNCSNLSSLRCGQKVDTASLCDYLPLISAHLVHLSFHLDPTSDHSLPPLEFPKLVSLRCQMSQECTHSQSIIRLAERWEMPLLQHFSSKEQAYLTGFQQGFQEGTISFLKKHGGGLTTLDLKCHWLRTYGVPQKILDLCPSLEHLVVVGHIPVDILKHQRLRVIDLWIELYKAAEMQEYDLAELSKKSMPSLQVVRCMDVSLSWRMRDLPYFLAPMSAEDQKAGNIEYYVYPGVRLRHDPKSLKQEDSLVELRAGIFMDSHAYDEPTNIDYEGNSDNDDIIEDYPDYSEYELGLGTDDGGSYVCRDGSDDSVVTCDTDYDDTDPSIGEMDVDEAQIAQYYA